MKVCYIISTTTNCGPVNVLFNLLKNYSDIKNFVPEIVTIKPDDSSKTRERDFKGLNVKINHFYNKNKMIDILNYIEKQDFDVVHSHGFIPDYINDYIRKKESKKRVHVTTLHNFPFKDYTRRKGIIIGNIMAVCHLCIIRKLIKVSCSNAIGKELKKIGVKTKVIENGIIIPKYHTYLRENSRQIFLYLGRLHNRKNVLFLCKYFEKHPELEFWIVGDGVEYEKIVANTKNINNIKIFGNTETPSNFYKRANYYISASKSEGLPLSVMEAMSYGLPCILSKIKPHQEVLTNDSMGELFLNNDMDSLNSAVKKIIKRKYNSRIIYESIANKFSANKMMNRYYKLYERENK